MEHEILSWLAPAVGLAASVSGVGALVYFGMQKSIRDARREREEDRERQHREREEDRERQHRERLEDQEARRRERLEDQEARRRERLEDQERLEQKMAELRKCIEDGRREDMAAAKKDLDEAVGRLCGMHEEHKAELKEMRGDITVLGRDVAHLAGRFDEFHDRFDDFQGRFVPRPQQGGEE